jgi:hypothetical protein
VAYERFGTFHRGGEIKAIASEHEEFGVAYGWTIWTAVGGEGFGGETSRHEEAMSCLLHALDAEEGAGERHVAD